MRLSHVLFTLAFISALSAPAHAQERYVGRFDFYSAFTYFESPSINLAERGYHLQFGVNMKPWYAIGFDYSNVNGTLDLLPKYLPKSIQDEINPFLQLAGPNYHPSLPTDTNTQTFALGPTLVIRRFHGIGILLHPSLGAVRERATPKPADPLIKFALPLFFTGTSKLDWQGFYGVGGAIDVHVTRHMSIRMHTDIVYDHLINDILANGRWTVRASIGPAFHLGKNIAH